MIEAVDRIEPARIDVSRLLKEALMRGEFERGDASGIAGLSECTARRVLNDVIADGLLASATPKEAASLRFPTTALEPLFPWLYLQAQSCPPSH